MSLDKVFFIVMMKKMKLLINFTNICHLRIKINHLSKTFNRVTNSISEYFNNEDINRNEKDVRAIRHQVVTIVEELNFEKQSIKVGN